MVEQMIEDLASHLNPQRAHPDEIALALLSGDMLLHKHDLLGLAVQNPPALDSSLQGSQLCFLQAPLVRAAQVLEQRLRLHSQEIVLYSLVMPCVSAGPTARSAQIVLTMITSYHDYMETYASHIARKSRDFAPFLKPNSSPARALKARNTSGGTINWSGLFFPSVGRESVWIEFRFFSRGRGGPFLSAEVFTITNSPLWL